MIRLFPIVSIIFVGLLVWLGDNLESALLAANKRSAKHSSLMVVYAVEASMMNGRNHQPWDKITERIPRDEGTEIDIIDTKGSVLFSTERQRRAGLYTLKDPLCTACHKGGSKFTSRETLFVDDPTDQSYLVFASPLSNRKDCRGCHVQDGSKLGMVFVKQNLKPVRRQVNAIQLGTGIAGLIALILTIVAARILLGRYLNRPLKKLIIGAKTIGEGNLNHVINLSEKTEMSVLSNTLNDSTVRLAKMQKELLEQERLAAVGETVAGLAHCLKNVLNGLRAGQYVIERAFEKFDEAKLRKGWGVILSSVRQVERIIHDMLYFVREREPKREPANPNDVIRDVMDLLKEQANGQGVKLIAELEKDLGTEELDRNLIYRAVLNLATNAIDACVESESGDQVVLRSHSNLKEIQISVEDNGIGMSEETQQQLFTRFFSTKHGKGTGLGLPVVKKIVEEHGGTIEMESAMDKGTKFTIHLPKRECESDA